MSAADGTREAPTGAPLHINLPAGVEVGETLAGKYRIDGILGVGGMGLVAVAHHLQLDEKVAIKFLLPEIAKNREAVSRFVREARAAIKIRSEYVARVSDVGTLPDGTPFMVMEHLDGRDLATWLRDDGPLAVGDAVELVLQACEAVAEAHRLRIIHRDLKPANLFVVRRADGLLAVRVLDFGISKTSGLLGAGSTAGLTRTSDVMGSPHYMSPEQLLAFHDVDMRTDIWALGVVIYQLVTGALPFDAETVPVLCSRIMQAPAEPIENHRSDLPPGFGVVVRKCLEKDRTRRFSDVGELALALEPFAPPRARSSVERISRTVAAAGFSPDSSASPAQASTVALSPAMAGGTQVLPPSASPSARTLSVPLPGDPSMAASPSAGQTQTSVAPGRRRAAITAVAFTVIAAAVGLWMSSGRERTPRVEKAEQASPPPPASATAVPAVVPPAPPEPAPAPAPPPVTAPVTAAPPPPPPEPVATPPAARSSPAPRALPEASRKAKPRAPAATRRPAGAANLMDLVDDRR